MTEISSFVESSSLEAVLMPPSGMGSQKLLEDNKENIVCASNGIPVSVNNKEQYLEHSTQKLQPNLKVGRKDREGHDCKGVDGESQAEGLKREEEENGGWFLTCSAAEQSESDSPEELFTTAVELDPFTPTSANSSSTPTGFLADSLHNVTSPKSPASTPRVSGRRNGTNPEHHSPILTSLSKHWGDVRTTESVSTRWQTASCKGGKVHPSTGDRRMLTAKDSSSVSRPSSSSSPSGGQNKKAGQTSARSRSKLSVKQMTPSPNIDSAKNEQKTKQNGVHSSSEPNSKQRNLSPPLNHHSSSRLKPASPPLLMDCSFAADITTQIPRQLHQLSNQELQQRLVAFGEQPGPVTDLTRSAYLAYLSKLEAGIQPAGNSGYKGEMVWECMCSS